MKLESDDLLLGRYRLVRALGAGAGGETWLAEGPAGLVAVKVLVGGHPRGAKAVADLLREAHILQQLQAEHVVGYRGVSHDADEDVAILVTDFVEGGDLGQLVAACGPLDQALVLAFGRQLVAGLAAAHAVGVLHRDLKPQNVLVGSGTSGSSQLRIVDFGISRFLVDGEAAPTTVMLTPGFAAPEQYRAGAALTTAADVHGLGAVMAFMLTGEAPHMGKQGDLVLPEGTPPALVDLLRSMTALAPHDRPTLDQVAELLGPGVPAPALPVGVAECAATPAQDTAVPVAVEGTDSRPWLALVAAGLVVAGVGAAAVLTRASPPVEQARAEAVEAAPADAAQVSDPVTPVGPDELPEPTPAAVVAAPAPAEDPAPSPQPAAARAAVAPTAQPVEPVRVALSSCPATDFRLDGAGDWRSIGYGVAVSLAPGPHPIELRLPDGQVHAYTLQVTDQLASWCMDLRTDQPCRSAATCR